MLLHPLSPSPSPSPSSSPLPSLPSTTTNQNSPSPPSSSNPPIDFSPPLIAMLVLIATAFIIITYSRLLSRHFLSLYNRYIRHRHRFHPSPSYPNDIESPPFDPSSAFHSLSPYGLEDAAINAIPLTLYTPRKTTIFHDCAVCLLEFEYNEYVRTLPICSHSFHVDCIDIWLRSHANCPLCRAGIFRHDSPFVPLMASRIRPSLDEDIIISEFSGVSEIEEEMETIVEAYEDNNNNNTNHNRRDFLLKRSYSFGYERNAYPNFGSENRRGFWSSNKRPSPFSTLTKHRVFSFRYYRGGGGGIIKSPFFRRRSMGGGSTSRRMMKSFAISPMFMRSGGGGTVFSSSRLRSGDPEALLSPERFNRRSR